jgi:hypothetical protein
MCSSLHPPDPVKTLAAFLSAVDGLFKSTVHEDTSVLYISPLRALANDIQKNLLGPIEQIRALDPSLPDIACSSGPGIHQPATGPVCRKRHRRSW